MSCFDFVVTDLDGTLFYDRENICDRDRDALHRLKAQGIRRHRNRPRTGRRYPGTRPAQSMG